MSSSESASTGSPSPSPPPETTQKISKGKKKTDKSSNSKASSTAIVASQEQEELLPYTPPTGAVLYKHDVDPAEFEWSTIRDDDDVDLWIIRVPEGLKSKHLENLRITLPESSGSRQVGKIERKHATYDVVRVDSDGEQEFGGEELRGLSCLLPRKKRGGKLYLTSKPIAHRLVISSSHPVPSITKQDHELAPQSSQPTVTVHQNPPRYSHPEHLLKHRFMPYGSLTQTDAPMDVNKEGKENHKQLPAESVSMTVEDEPANVKSTKKRKVEKEGETSKKSKKLKTVAAT